MLHKYIRYKSYGFILWPYTDVIIHKDMASTFNHLKGPPLSAGLAEITDGLVWCYGESISLSLSSSKEDSTEIANQLGISTL